MSLHELNSKEIIILERSRTAGNVLHNTPTELLQRTCEGKQLIALWAAQRAAGTLLAALCGQLFASLWQALQ